MPIINLPNPLVKIHGNKQLHVKATNILEALVATSEANDGFKGKLLNEQKELLNFVVVFLNNQDIRMLDHLETQVEEEDEIKILFAVAGG